MRLILRALIWTTLTLLGLLLTLAGTALSPWGSHWLLEQAQSRGYIAFERVEGAPLDDFALYGLQLETPALSLMARRFELQWADDCLLSGRLCIDRLAAEGVRVRLRDAGDTTPTPPPPQEAQSDGGRIATPLPIELRELMLADIDVQLADGTRLQLGRFTSAATFEGSQLNLAPTELINTSVILPGPPGLDHADPLASSVDVRTARRVANADIVSAAAIEAAERAVQPPAPVLIEAGDSTFALSPEALAAAEQIAAPGPLAQLAALAERPVANPLAGVFGSADDEGRILPADFTLPLDVDVEQFTLRNLYLVGDTPLTVNELVLAAHAEGSRVELSRFDLDSSLATLSMTAQATLSGDYPLTLSASAELAGAPLPGERVDVSLDGSLADLNLELDASGPVAARLQAHSDLLAPALPFRLALEAPSLRWPLEPAADDRAWQLDDLAFNAEGSLRDYRVRLSANVDGPPVEPLGVSLDGSGDLRHFNWSPLAVTSGEGRLESSGTARWESGLAVDASLSLDQLELARFTDAVSGRLNGETQVRFDLLGGGSWRVEVPQLAIDGTLQQRALSLQGQFSGNSAMQWQIDRLDLRQGDNRLNASGRIGEQLSLQADLSAPALGTIMPQLGGSASGRIRLGGSLASPDSNIQLNGEGLRFQDNRIGRLAMAVTTAGLDDPRVDLELNASDIAAAGQRIDSLATTLDGRLGQHRLEVQLEGGAGLPVSSARLALEGGLGQARQRYRGRLTTLAVSTPQAGDIALESPFAFDARIDQSRVNAQPFCLVRQQGGRLCAVEPLTASAQRGSAALRLSEVALASANDFLPDPWRISGDLSGNINLDWSRGGASWQLLSQLDSSADISGRNANGQPFSLPQLQLQLNVDATPARADADLDLRLQNAGRLQLEADIGDPLGARSLSGRLRADGLQLSPYTPLVVVLDRLAGQLNGDISLSGTAQSPKLNGSMVLSDVSAGGDQLPVALEDARMAMDFNGDSGNLNGYLQANGTRWDLAGDARWPTTGSWRARMALNGADAPLEVRLPQFGRIRIAPDLEVTANPSRLSITGDVRIPWARLEVGQMPPSAVQPSGDEVIVTREEYEARQQQAIERAARDGIDEQSDWATTEDLQQAGMDVNVAVNLIIGDDVQLQAYGLNADVRGSLDVRQSSGSLQLFGDVSLVDGRFRALGQDLLIRRGQVLFSGPPGQPYLDIEAIRNPEVTQDDVIAGLRVTGAADQPQLEVFSEPAMNETRALSYMLRGRAPDASGDSDGMLTSALIGLSLSRSGAAIGQLGQAFGIEDLSLDTSGSGEDSQVVVSGYLFDDLQVSYGVGLFSPIAELTLRYRLLQNLYLQAVSGANQAVDLIYTFSLGRTPALGERQ